ncbi:glutathione binding-like protein [Myxococcus sp. K38C18041901]|uniref:glutathione binding-like protein n=1 Tax=Myxococcus guangdongensis TaxID=2906760 RepID=UPI0020A6EA0A|nr:glutathione binding-like protein [Myxococcus guangdongensis]MCP3059814.1 glutathione binding-like protein [Myxococcus guangdongensis]
MQLYFLPMSCSLATRISLYEAGADVRFIPVDRKTKQTAEGQDYHEVHPLGLVPALRKEDGAVLFESAAILQYIAHRWPDAKLAPVDPQGREQLQRWLSFVATELHKVVFAPVFDVNSPNAVKEYALAKAPARLDVLEHHLSGREFLLDAFSVADAYCFVVLNWCGATPLDLKKWPALSAYVSRLRERPNVARAVKEEWALYSEHKAAHP